MSQQCVYYRVVSIGAFRYQLISVMFVLCKVCKFVVYYIVVIRVLQKEL